MTVPAITLLDDSHGENTLLYTFAVTGDELPLHWHTFMHRAMIPAGSSFEWFSERNCGDVTGPHVLTFPAGVRHGMRALNNGACCFVVMPATAKCRENT